MDLVARVRRRVEELARRMLREIVGEVPPYAHLPKEELEGDILAICRANVEFFLDSLAEQGRPSEDALAHIHASAVRRAEEGVPLEALLTAYHVGSRVAWDALHEEAGADEQGDLVRLAGALLAYVQAVTTTVSDAYVEERGSILDHERDARRARLDALLAGGAPHHSAEALGESPAGEYVVIALAFGPSLDEIDEAVEATVAARRKVRRVESFLDERVGGGVLCRIDRSGGLALLPTATGEAARVVADASDLVDALGKVADAEVTASVAWREGGDDVRPAVAEAREVLRLARDAGREAGVYTLDDLLLEYVASRPGSGRERLVALLGPLEDGPDLILTLEAWFQTDFDRRRAAAAVHVHPNTLDYRLRRVADLTGLDPGTGRGIQLLGAALTARRVVAADGS